MFFNREKIFRDPDRSYREWKEDRDACLKKKT